MNVILSSKQNLMFGGQNRNGMHKNCAINCDHIQTGSKAKIGSLITALSKEKLVEIRNAICFALNL